MKGLFSKIFNKKQVDNKDNYKNINLAKNDTQSLNLKVEALFNLLKEIHGSDQLILKAGKLDALHLMRSKDLFDKVCSLKRLMYEDPTIERLNEETDIEQVINELEDELAEKMTYYSVENEIEAKINERMQNRHQEYIKEIRAQILKEELGPDNAQTLKKYAELESLEERKLSNSALEIMSPKCLSDVVGQEQAIKSLLAKLSSPYPQHIILYGPPGVGKTTVARLALAEAQKRSYTPFAKESPFIEVNGTTLRWDPREVTNPLLGSVHDPIYQGARRELAESSIPEPKLGLVSDAHGGVLFIDEIGELESILQNKLLKVLEDKRVLFDSSYYDPDDPQVPKYVRQLFSKGAPANFILIGATTREPSDINPALRSRCAEVFFNPLNKNEIAQIIKNAANRLGVALHSEIPSMLAEYTIDGRQGIRLLADAYSVALNRWHENEKVNSFFVDKSDLLEVIQSSRLTPYVSKKGSDAKEEGKVFGLGVNGYLGSVLEIEAVVFQAKKLGKGLVRFNETAGSMAKDSVFNAASVFRQLTKEELSNYDIHINVVGGGQIDGPSAGAAILIAIVSAIYGMGIPQNIAVTGEISIKGNVKPIGGLQAKIYGAQQAGIKKVFIPKENSDEINNTVSDVEIIPVKNVTEILQQLFPGLFDQDTDIQVSAIG